MDLPIWIILAFLILIVALTFILMCTHDNIRLIKWEQWSRTVLDTCGYTDIIQPKIIKSHKTYTIGKYSTCGITKSVTIFLCIDYDDNTIMSALLHQLTHIIHPTINHNNIIFQTTLEKLSLCVASGFSNNIKEGKDIEDLKNLEERYDPFKTLAKDYPMKE